MNDKRKNDGSKAPSGDINLDDLTELENELNDLSNDIDVEPRNIQSRN